MSEGLTFKKVCGPEHPVADVVFIHGLTGDPRETWESVDGQYWPEWLCGDFEGLAVYTLGYPASVFGKWAKKEMDLFERATNALEYMVATGIGDRPLILITHSLGGLLAKQIIRKSRDSEDEDCKKIAQSMKLVVFLATPHTGASLAGILKSFVPHFSSKHVSILTNETGVLDDINEHYRSYANGKSDLKTVVYYEKYKTANAALVVTKESSDPGVAGTTPVPVDKDHVTICKPKDSDDLIYVSITRHLKALLSKTPQDCGAFQEDGYTSKSDIDRRDLLEKLIAANREHEYEEANNYQNKFAQNYLRLGLFTKAKEENDKLLSEVETRFVTHVYHPLICKYASDDAIRTALQSEVIDPVCAKRVDEKNFSEKTVLSALYFLTEQCHIRWDAKP
jgi:YHS domain-containing protein/pimeloyl-ACP methyl ester carboxylesterase